MRTTVDLPPALHRRAQELAKERGQSLSSILAELTVRGLAQTDAPVRLNRDPRTGLPVVSIGREVSDDDVARVLADE